MDIIGEVNTYLLTKITPYATIRQDVFMWDSTEEIICRRDPSNALETRYMDKARAGAKTISYYAKSLDMTKAVDQLDAIIKALDLPGDVRLTEVLSVKIEPVSSPAFVSRTDKLEYIYTAAFRLNYFVRGV